MNIINASHSYFVVVTKRLLCLLALVFISANAYAGCPTVANVTGPAEVEVNASLPVGSVVGELQLSWPNTSTGCEGPNDSSAAYKFVGVGTPDGNVYPTNVPGLGYRGKLPGWAFAGLDGWWPTSNYWGSTTASTIAAGSVDIQFVKTGSIDAGGYFGPQDLMLGTINDGAWFNIHLDSTIHIKPAAPACTVTQSAISVTLDDVSPVELDTAGSTAKDKAFVIPLKCDREANVSLSFSGTVADQANGVFKNTTAETTDTVGIQLLDENSNPVLAGDDNAVAVGKINGPLSYPMTARYYALAPNAPAGNVSAVVYATIIYN